MKTYYGYRLAGRIKKNVFVFFFVLSHCVCLGQDIRNGSNMTMGRIEADGTVRNRNKLEKSKEEGDNFLKKAIAALNDYTQ